MNNTVRAWLSWGIVVTFFAFQFVLRPLPGLVMPEIMAKFQIDATQFGIFSGAYYVGYAGMHIPIGILFSRFNSRYVISSFIFICLLGVLCFGHSESWPLTILGRFLIGTGSAVAFLGSVHTARMLFPEDKLPRMIGLSFTVGLMGALYGGKPVSLMVDRLGWTSVVDILAGINFAVLLLIFFFLPKQPEGAQATEKNSDQSSIAQSLKELLGNWKIMTLALGGALLVGPFEAFADIWGVNYLVKTFGVAKDEASLITSFIYFGMIFGGPVLCWIAQKIKDYYLVTALSGLVMFGIFTFLLTSTGFVSTNLAIAMMTVVGIASCYQVVVFVIVCSLVPARLSVLATSFTNTINMMAGSLFHIVMGQIMDYTWSGQTENGLKVYDANSCKAAVASIPITLLLGSLVVLFVKIKAEGRRSIVLERGTEDSVAELEKI